MAGASTFELLPAIDLIGGRVVRLREGDFARATDYGADPVEVARAFVAAGAAWIHIVDLDGAKAGRCCIEKELRALAAAHIPYEVGGGIRSMAWRLVVCSRARGP